MSELSEYKISKYRGKWAVYCPISNTFSYVGAGKKACEAACKRLNAMLTREDIEWGNRHVMERFMYD